jgi:hypothetical protein
MKPFQALPATEDPSVLSAWLCEEASRLPDHRLYALLDGGQLEGLPYKRKSMAPDAFGALFGVLGKTDLETAGGWLLEISKEDPKRWEWTCLEALRQPAVLWLQSPLRFPDLQVLLATRIEVKLTRGPEVYLRYYDPRIFTNLVDLMHPSQAPFLAMAPRWFWLDHSCQRCVLEVPLDLEAARRIDPPLVLDQEQEKILLEGSLPYEVMAILHSEAPEVLEAIPRNARYDLLRQGVEGARAQGAHRLSDLVGFCLAFLDPVRGAPPAR